MIKQYLKSISSGYILIAVGILIAIVLAYIYSLNYKIKSLRADLAESNSQVVILSNSINVQNEAIRKQGIDSAKKIADATLAVNLLKQSQKVKQGKINALKDLLGKVQTCEQAVVEAKKSL